MLKRRKVLFATGGGSAQIEARPMSRLVQISLEDQSYAEQLYESLRADTTFEDCEIVCGSNEEMHPEVSDGVRVIDAANLQLLPQPLLNPAKTLLISSGFVNLTQAWELGIVSVLKNSEPLEYVKLAILAALLRPAKPRLAISNHK